MLIAVYDAASSDRNVAAVCIHGVYDSVAEAQTAAEALARERPDEQHPYVIDECNRWLRVQPPGRETAMEEVEIRAPENHDPGAGKMGSVCDLKGGPRISVEQEASPGDSPGVATFLHPDRRRLARLAHNLPRHRNDGVDSRKPRTAGHNSMRC